MDRGKSLDFSPRRRQMFSLSMILMALLGSMLNARIINGRLGLWEDFRNRGSELVQINGPLGRISGGNASKNEKDLSSDLTEMITTQAVQNVMDVDGTKFRQCEISEAAERINDSTLVGSEARIKCNGVANLTISLGLASDLTTEIITSISISNTILKTLDLTQFYRFPFLRNLSVTKCNVSIVIGAVPGSVRNLNLSHNNIKSVDNFLSRDEIKQYTSLKPSSPSQSSVVGETENWDVDGNLNNATTQLPPKFRKEFSHNNNTETTTNSWTPLPETAVTSSKESEESKMGLGDSGDGTVVHDSNEGNSVMDPNNSGTLVLEVIDLSFNKITELPKSLFTVVGIRSLRLSGNHLKCEFVWEKLWEWTNMWTSHSMLSDPDGTFCGDNEGVRVFQYTIERVLQARKEVEKTCATVDKSLCSRCSLYALQKEGHQITQPRSDSIRDGNKGGIGESISVKNENSARIVISLKLDCSSKNLTELPPVPPQTWQLNISKNLIRDLSPLKLPMYSNLLILDGKSNQINLETLEGTPFIEKYNYLNLQNNRFLTIPTYILISLRTIRGQGVTFLGGNNVDCDCSSVKEIKPLLIENSKRIRDMKDIFCRDMSILDGRANRRVIDLQYSDVCHMDSSDPNFASELYLYLIIFGEATLTVLIIAKVWVDRKHFRQTGVLPWCSANMPRLPCDAMLESIKEPVNLNNGSATSSNANIHNTSSVSHIHLKDIPGTDSGRSSRLSRSVKPHFSGCPSTSSRTSSV